MPHRNLVSTELAKLFGVLSHPIRVRIIEELHHKSLSVNELKDILSITHSAVSQQLAILRANHLVVETRQGRNVYYALREPQLAAWIADGLGFISPDRSAFESMLAAIEQTKSIWTAEDTDSK